MPIKAKLGINLFVFILCAIYLGYQEMYTLHPDAIKIFNLKM